MGRVIVPLQENRPGDSQNGGQNREELYEQKEWTVMSRGDWFLGGFSEEDAGKRRESIPGKEGRSVQCGGQPRPADR